MANENPVDFSGAINGLMESIVKIGQAQVDLVNNGIKSIAPVLHYVEGALSCCLPLKA